MVMFNEYSAFNCSFILDILLLAHDSMVLIARTKALQMPILTYPVGMEV